MKEKIALQIALFAAEQLLRHAPAMFAEFVSAVSGKDITADELRRKRAFMLEQKFSDVVPNATLPPGTGD